MQNAELRERLAYVPKVKRRFGTVIKSREEGEEANLRSFVRGMASAIQLTIVCPRRVKSERSKLPLCPPNKILVRTKNGYEVMSRDQCAIALDVQAVGEDLRRVTNRELPSQNK